MKIVLIIPVLLICTGVTASEYRSDFPVFLQDTIIHTDSLTFTGKEEALKRKARKRDNEKLPSSGYDHGDDFTGFRADL